MKQIYFWINNIITGIISSSPYSGQDSIAFITFAIYLFKKFSHRVVHPSQTFRCLCGSHLRNQHHSCSTYGSCPCLRSMVLRGPGPRSALRDTQSLTAQFYQRSLRCGTPDCVPLDGWHLDLGQLRKRQ